MDVTNMTKTAALKEFFGTNKPVITRELMDLRKADPAGYDELATLAKAELAKIPS